MNSIKKDKLKKFLTNIKVIVLKHYNEETKKNILKNLKYCKNLEILNCCGNELTELYELPNTLKTLDCSYNKLVKLPELPNTLIILNCCSNNLTELPKLPNTFNTLDCSYNNLTELPDLPCSLKKLYCYKNNLTELPDLPNKLTDLNCSNNNLTELPDLPDSLVCYRFAYDDFKLNYPIINFEDYEGDEYYILRVKIINETNKINLKNKIIKRIKLLNRNLLLEWSARICMNPKRIQRLLNANEIDFFDGSFDTLTY
jgi:Leucine-rich repeat (LRR) protein